MFLVQRNPTEGHHEYLDWSHTNRFSFGDLIATTVGNLPADGRSWRFDSNNELGVFIGNSFDVKNGCRIYWPTTRAISDRLWCWRIEMSDAQYLDYIHKHAQLFDSPSTSRRIANAP